MLSCKDISHLASDHIDQNLPFFIRMKVKMHLSMCKNCREFIKQFKITVNVIKQVKASPTESSTRKQDTIDLQVQTLIKARQEIVQSRKNE